MEDLVKRLRASVDGRYEKCDVCPYEEDYPCCVDCLDKMHKQASDAIEELQQIAAHYEETSKDYFKDACYYRERDPHWIPATALPSENNRYLTVSIEPWFGTTVVDIMRWSGVWMYDGRQTEATVTHWMPLPEPPKEE